jgi:hypothetical protein
MIIALGLFAQRYENNDPMYATCLFPLGGFSLFIVERVYQN